MSSISYTPERAEELKDNINGVLADVRKAGSDKVSLRSTLLVIPS
jgi:hypothetical protein